jgi:glucokinase
VLQRRVGTSTSTIEAPKCGWCKRGCIEVYASGLSIARRTRAKLAEGLNRQSAVLELANGNIEAVTGKTIGQAYEAGDPLATELLQETIVFLAHWLGNIVDLLEPDVMVIGGGVALMLSRCSTRLRINFLVVVLTHVVKRFHLSWPAMVQMRAEERCAQ